MCRKKAGRVGCLSAETISDWSVVADEDGIIRETKNAG
jgi:hypothetical protein